MKFDGPDALVAQLEQDGRPPGRTSANETSPLRVESMMRPAPSSRTVLPSLWLLAGWLPSAVPATGQLEAKWIRPGSGRTSKPPSNGRNGSCVSIDPVQMEGGRPPPAPVP